LDISGEWLAYEIDICRCNQPDPKIAVLGGLQTGNKAVIAQNAPAHEYRIRHNVHCDLECLRADWLEHSTEECGVLRLSYATRLTWVFHKPHAANQSHIF
jgi:hypothetical protein